MGDGAAGGGAAIVTAAAGIGAVIGVKGFS